LLGGCLIFEIIVSSGLFKKKKSKELLSSRFLETCVA
jgi:hypothetical protein